ncbi:hypothetical protein [Methyloversatilis sp. XJ19-49]|uniref:hypothetical protein n=1 Tax=Methyloversatilis sp. XJ19-49 TaxID=2963429 RepID=UPI00211C5143|nr:hypothetical protein [Methyloversatilis sp. XJ19-49]MCQ9378806.1 hypothetical protein [Methyloversatilis sp. XJ19-49]
MPVVYATRRRFKQPRGPAHGRGAWAIAHPGNYWTKIGNPELTRIEGRRAWLGTSTTNKNVTSPNSGVPFFIRSTSFTMLCFARPSDTTTPFCGGAGSTGGGWFISAQSMTYRRLGAFQSLPISTTANDDHLYAMVGTPSEVSAYVDGEFVTSFAAGLQAATVAPGDCWILGNNTATYRGQAAIYYVAYIPRTLSAAEIRAIAQNPWRIFEATDHRLYFDVPSGAATVSADGVLRWSLTSAVHADQALRWSLNALAQRDATLMWSLLQTAQREAIARWSLVAALNADATLRWSLVQAVQADADLCWSMLAAVASDTTLLWDMAGATGTVSRDFAARWSMLAPVSADAEFHWNLLQAVAREQALPWSMVQAIASDVGLRWSLIQAVSADADLAWNLVQAVSRDAALAWDIAASLGTVAASLSLRWSLIAAVQQSIDARWNLLEFVNGDTSLRWAMLTATVREITARWDITALAARTVDLRWDMAGTTGRAITFRWSVGDPSNFPPLFVYVAPRESRTFFVAAPGMQQ